MSKNSAVPATRRLLAAWLFHKDPWISDVEVNRAFEALDTSGDRSRPKDASHFRKLWRQGRLEVPESDPRTW